MEKRFLKGDAAIEHLKAGGTLWDPRPYFLDVDSLLDNNSRLSDPDKEREVRTEPPVDEERCVSVRPERLIEAHRLPEQCQAKPRAYAVGDIVTGDEAYRLVELGAKVVSGDEIDQSPGLGYVVVDGEFAFDMGHGLLNTTTKDSFVSHARRTLWNPDADEWCIVEPPKTITAEEARKVVAAGGAVARTFVAPESEWADGSVNNGPGTKSVADFAYALFADGSEWVVRRAAPENAGVLTAEELADVEFAEANYLYGLSVRLAATVRSLEKELTKVTKEYSDLCAQWRAR
jgi:hypothetical protein